MSDFYSTGFSNCCKDCQKRFVGCHSTCETYIEAKKAHEIRRQEERENSVRQLRIIDFNRLGYGQKTKTRPKHRRKR